MRTTVAFSLLFLCCSPQDPHAPTSERPRPVDVFAELDGVWAGTFVGYDVEGVELYRIAVEQRYETVDDATQRVRVRDVMPDGTVITGEGENTATRAADGSLALKCVVRKSNGETVEHAGRSVRGPGNDEQLVWFSRAQDRDETFREWVEGEGVEGEGDAAVYHIHGMGRYGETAMLMVGRYVKRE